MLRFRNGPFHDVAQVKPDGPCAADVSHSRPLGTRRKKKNLVVATWNVRTLLDQNSSKSKRPERRSALVAKELRRYNIDIAALSEVRWAEEGCLYEEGGGYTFYWKGKSLDEDRVSGVGFAISSRLLKSVHLDPVGINDRLMTLRIPVGKGRYATLVSAYAPTFSNLEEVNAKFYLDLEAVMQSIPFEDKIVIMGDFNARVGKDYQTWEGVIGRHGYGEENENGYLLLDFCTQNNLVITNTTFQQKNRFKTTWMHLRSKKWHLIDYIIVRQRDRKDVELTRAMRGAECWTDHRLVRAKLMLSLRNHKRNHHKKVARQNISVELLRDSENIRALNKKIGCCYKRKSWSRR